MIVRTKLCLFYIDERKKSKTIVWSKLQYAFLAIDYMYIRHYQLVSMVSV